MSAEASDLSRLTGVRSGKNSYYPAFLRSTERMHRTVQAMDQISRAVVRTVEGPRAVLEAVARAAAEHLDARWAVLALSDGHLRGARPRLVAIGPDHTALVSGDSLPDLPQRELRALRAGESRPAISEFWVRVPMYLEARCVGGLSVHHALDAEPEPEDLAVLRILANQAAVSLHTSEQYRAGVTLHRRAQRLKREAQAQAQDLAQRTAELQATERRLVVAMQRELLDTERHRIARELHDSVTQYVLSAGMAVELARGEAETLGMEAVTTQLGHAKTLTQTAVEQLRTAIYALTQGSSGSVTSLEELISALVAHHGSLIDIKVIAEGVAVCLGDVVHHEIARVVGEALFNTVAHAHATRAIVRVRYRPTSLTVSIADDGDGSPTAVRRMLRLEQRMVGDGRHRGLANMEERIRAIGGTLSFRRARIGGIRVVLSLPMPGTDGPDNPIVEDP